MSEIATVEAQQKSLVIAKLYFQAHLGHMEAYQYLVSRDLNSASLRKFGVGFAPSEWRGLVEHFSSAKIRSAAVDAGLLRTSENSGKRLLDFFRGRLMFPIHNESGVLVGYGGRRIDDDESTQKYINTPETELFQKGKILYGLHEHRRAIEASREALIVEGYTDVIRLSRYHHQTAVAPMGTALTDHQVRLLLGLGVRTFYVCFDGDSAGARAAARNIGVLMDHYQPEMTIWVIQLPPGEDPDSLIRSHGPDAFTQAKAEAIPLAVHIHRTCMAGMPEHPCLEDKALYLTRLEPYIDRSCGVLQDQLIRQASDLTGLDASQIRGADESRARATQVNNWAPLVLLAARLIVHDQNSAPAARAMSLLEATERGAAELKQLANARLEGKQPEGMLFQYAISHGPLHPPELDQLKSNWGAWARRAQVEHNLNQLHANPHDNHAKETLRQMLR